MPRVEASPKGIDHWLPGGGRVAVMEIQTAKEEFVQQHLLKSRILGPDPVVGLYMEFEDPLLLEIACRSGVDFLVLEAQLGQRDPGRLGELIRTADITQTPCLVRVGPEATPGSVARLLSAGAMGIFASFDGTVASAQELASWTMYPPRGIRPGGYARGGTGFREYRPWMHGPEEYERRARANDDVVIVLRIDTEEAIQNLPELVQIPGVTAILPSMGNLSHNLGVPLDSPEFARLMKQIEGVADPARGCGVIHHIGSSAGVARMAAAGASAFLIGHDTLIITRFLSGLVREVVEAAGVKRVK